LHIVFIKEKAPESDSDASVGPVLKLLLREPVDDDAHGQLRSRAENDVVVATGEVPQVVAGAVQVTELAARDDLTVDLSAVLEEVHDDEDVATGAAVLRCLQDGGDSTGLQVDDEEQDFGIRLSLGLELHELGTPVLHLWIVELDPLLLEEWDHGVLTPRGGIAGAAQENLLCKGHFGTRLSGGGKYSCIL
jgi:hypothetical protein